MAPLPEVTENGLGHDVPLARRVERPEVDDQHPPVLFMELLEDRPGLVHGPDLPLVDPEVPDPAHERFALRSRGGLDLLEPESRDRLGDPLEAQQVLQLRVLLPIGDRVQTQHTAARSILQLAEAEPETFIRLCGVDTTYDDPGDRRETCCETRVSVGSYLGQTDEVGVGVEDHHPQRRLEQEPFENDPERVRLPGPGLPAKEGVAVEAGPLEHGREILVDESQCSDLETGGCPSCACQMPAHLVRRRGREHGIDDWFDVLLEHGAFALHDS